jgi:hypothetical protein
MGLITLPSNVIWHHGMFQNAASVFEGSRLKWVKGPLLFQGLGTCKGKRLELQGTSQGTDFHFYRTSGLSTTLEAMHKYLLWDTM